MFPSRYLVIGSGTSVEARTDAETRAVRNILDGSDPVVVDAGALDLAASATAPAVITPHAVEHAKLRSALGLDPDSFTIREGGAVRGLVAVPAGPGSTGSGGGDPAARVLASREAPELLFC